MSKVKGLRTGGADRTRVVGEVSCHDIRQENLLPPRYVKGYLKRDTLAKCCECGAESLLSRKALKSLDRSGRAFDQWRCPECRERKKSSDRLELAQAILAILARKKGLKP